MADRLGLGPEVRELKLGPTFTNNKSAAFHTVKYDFKPASVDVSKIAMVDVGTNNTMTVTVPHLDGAGLPNTVFKGSQRPHHKECVLIIDRVTGEITLEKLSSNIQVKKTRSETKTQHHLSAPSTNSSARPITPVELKNNPTDGRNNSRTKVSTGKKREPIVQLHPKNTHSPFRASPYHGKSPSSNHHVNSSTQPTSQSTLASLPMIGFDNDDFSISTPVPTPVPVPPKPQPPPPKPQITAKPPEFSRLEGDLSDSSSSSSSSDSSDSESDVEKIPVPPRNGQSNGLTSPPMLMPDIILNDDLQLSESESDSD